MRMAEELSRPDVKEDIFAEHAQWLAAETRQFFRAHRARDTKAVEVALSYFIDYMTKVLHRHLSKCDPAWDSSIRPLDFSSHRWFDGLSADPEITETGRLRLRGEICWMIGQEQRHFDPLDFEIELCPMTGAFRKYLFRFGDSRPRAAKVRGSASQGIPMGAWAYEFEKQSSEHTAKEASYGAGERAKQNHEFSSPNGVFQTAVQKPSRREDRWSAVGVLQGPMRQSQWLHAVGGALAE